MNGSSFVKELYVMSGPNLTERVTLQQENITWSSQLFYDLRLSKIGILMLIYIYEMEYETVIIDLSYIIHYLWLLATLADPFQT